MSREKTDKLRQSDLKAGDAVAAGALLVAEMTIDKTLNMKRAIWTWARLALSRVKAYGNKWYKWYVKQRLWQQKKTKTIPEQYRRYTLIEFGPQGDNYISSKLRISKTLHGCPRRVI